LTDTIFHKIINFKSHPIIPN